MELALLIAALLLLKSNGKAKTVGDQGDGGPALPYEPGWGPPIPWYDGNELKGMLDFDWAWSEFPAEDIGVPGFVAHNPPYLDPQAWEWGIAKPYPETDFIMYGCRRLDVDVGKHDFGDEYWFTWDPDSVPVDTDAGEPESAPLGSATIAAPEFDNMFQSAAPDGKGGKVLSAGEQTAPVNIPSPHVGSDAVPDEASYSAPVGDGRSVTPVPAGAAKPDNLLGSDVDFGRNWYE